MLKQARAPRWILALFVFAVAGAVTVATSQTGPTPPIECNNNAPCPGSTCAKTVQAAAQQFPDACPFEGESQSDVDIFSWNSFIAMNWPANTSTCGPNLQASILSGSGPVVWETYTQDSAMFVASGTPAAWCAQGQDALAALPQNLRAAAAKAGVTKVFFQNSKSSEIVEGKMPGIEEAVGGVLTDQNGRFVRYEKRMNQDEYNYIFTNKFWTASAQKAATISFPTGAVQNPSPCGAKQCGTTGAMEIKAAWKVLSPSEISGNRFYMAQAWVYNDDAGNPSPGKNPVTVGLVGLHIIHKTAKQSTWFWSTFEHVDNTTTSFYNPKCTTCLPNSQTAAQPYTELDSNGNPINKPVQVVRVNPGTDDLDDLNTYYQGLLKGSVWANYQLIGTQWTTGGAPKGTPALLANTTMETFIQPQSSCFGCHSGAPKAGGAAGTADLSFLLSEAQQ